ncbi:MAG: DUF4468 domain-containing protein [Tannerellaceae bacterium]|jgi:hypothetical protein|nr:DUF4468 domain-containing protein [Tannerellaceae bacterium]
MMKKYLVLLLVICPALVMAQGHKGKVETCAPVKNGKICYTDEVSMPNTTKAGLYNAINAWAKKSYGKDIFLSNHSSNKAKGTIQASSKVELLLNETDKTLVKYKLNITCLDEKYTVEVNEITYQYDANKDKQHKTYKAEDVITNNGKDNKVAAIKDPLLFCNATYFFVESLFADVFSAASEAE